MSNQYYGSYFTADLNEINRLLTINLSNKVIKSRICGIVFAHPEDETSKSKILPMIDYWNFRSKDYIDFYFPGYLGDPNIGDSEFGPNIPDASKSELDGKFEELIAKLANENSETIGNLVNSERGKFKNMSFVNVIDFFEKYSKWSYNGNPTLLLIRGYLNSESKSCLDFSTILEIDLSRTEQLQNNSVANIFESIIKATKQSEFADLNFNFMSKLFGKTIGDTIIDTILDNLPINLTGLFKSSGAIRII